MAAGLSRGLRMDDAYEMDIGSWIDYVIEYNNVNCDEEHKVKYATQKDFDNF